jgi:predicted MFS family arabinose efflux permease
MRIEPRARLRESISERAVIFVIGAIQFVNIVDFMIVMPLGPDFSGALGIPVSQLGVIGGSYTAAAAIAGLAGSLFLDRFDRKKALICAMVGLVVGTALGSVARGFASLVFARVVAGAFGGPATSLSYSIIADVIPAERRGKAMGTVMAAFGVAAVLGVPFGLELSHRLSWRAPFIGTALVGAIVTATAFLLLPSLEGHLEKTTSNPLAHLRGLLRRDVLASYAMTFVAMMGTFVMIPNISPFVVQNLAYPRARLGLLYLAGGAVSLVASRLTGIVADRFGSAKTGSLGSVVMSAITYVGFAAAPPLISPMPVIMFFMMSTSFRNVSLNTLTSKVPNPEERASFSSVQSAVQHMAAACGAFISARVLTEDEHHNLVGMSSVAWLSIIIALMFPPLLFMVERRLERRAEFQPRRLDDSRHEPSLGGD